MITDHFERFTLLERCAVPDGLGGEAISWRPVLIMRGALTHECGTEISVGGRATLRSTPVLLHEFDVTLRPGDCVRRERDGAMWRVTGSSADMRTPAYAGLQFAQVPVEGLVI
ncbi:MAG: hypothetical protein IJ343_10790 [Clostridia bacterium]|nr:hypothetical protein [Clostridia bacterium]